MFIAQVCRLVFRRLLDFVCELGYNIKKLGVIYYENSNYNKGRRRKLP